MTIIASLQGGLGNQMFIYAFARNMSLMRGDGLKLYGDRLSKANTPREFELGKFGIALDYDDGEFRKVVTEGTLEYNPYMKQIAINLPGKTLMYDGYFQSEKYFEENKDKIVKDFKWVESSLSDETLEYKDKIQKYNKKYETVAVHIRRSDYLDKDSVMEILGHDYYFEAMDYIIDKYSNAKFICFSDDIEWCKNNIPECSEYINNDSSDMYLLQLCKHQIIANSSFSWWAAYLNNNKKKIIIGPKKWYKSNDINPCLESWIKL